MLLALALCAHANVPHWDLTCCTTTGERIGWTGASSSGSLSLPAACAHSSDTSASASIVAVIGAVALSLPAAAQSDSHPDQTGNEVLIAVRASDGGGVPIVVEKRNAVSSRWIGDHQP